MLKIRLKRIGRKHDPSFRIVVTEHTAPATGKYLEAVGFYNAALKQLELNRERIEHWLSQGVQPTAVVHNILVKEGIVKGDKIAVHARPKKKEGTEEKKEESQARAEEAPAEEPAETLQEADEQAPKEEAQAPEPAPEQEEAQTQQEAPAAEQEEPAKEEAKDEAPAEEPAEAPQEQTKEDGAAS